MVASVGGNSSFCTAETMLQVLRALAVFPGMYCGYSQNLEVIDIRSAKPDYSISPSVTTAADTPCTFATCFALCTAGTTASAGSISVLRALVQVLAVFRTLVLFVLEILAV